MVPHELWIPLFYGCELVLTEHLALAWVLQIHAYEPRDERPIYPKQALFAPHLLAVTE